MENSFCVTFLVRKCNAITLDIMLDRYLSVKISWLLLQDKWIGGFVDNEGRPVTTFDGIKLILDASFEFIEEIQLPCIQRRHGRSYNYFINHVTVWRRTWSQWPSTWLIMWSRPHHWPFVKKTAWREHPQHCRSTLTIMLLWILCTIG